MASLLKLLSFRNITLLLGLLVITILLYGYLYEQNHIVLENVDVKVDSLPDEFNNLKLLQFSDLHFKKVGTREKRLREIINKIKPDIIFFTGDLFNSKKNIKDPQIVDNAMKYLKSLHFKKNFFLIWGEQEYYFREYLKERLREINVTVLDDKIFFLNIGNHRLKIIGFTEDLKTFDTFYDRRLKGRIERFLRFSKLKILEGYRDYYFYVGGQFSLKWRDYEVSGRIKIPSSIKDFGIAFYSQFPMGKYRSYFLSLDSKQKVFYLTSSGKENNFQGNTFSRIRVEDSKWFSYKINVRSLPDKTAIRAKIWDGTQDEPASWEIDSVDFGKNKITRGTVGIYFLADKKNEYLGDIRVKMLNYNDRNKELHNVAGELPLDNEFYEGVTEIPLDENFDQIISEDSAWMTLQDIKEFIVKEKKADTLFFSEKKLSKLMKKKNPAQFTILLSHRPNVVSIADDKGIDLILSGHTQGGQVNFPFLKELIFKRFNFSEYKGEKLDSGLKKFSGTYLYINRGIGTSIIPFRFGSSPEVTLLRLSST